MGVSKKCGEPDNIFDSRIPVEKPEKVMTKITEDGATIGDPVSSLSSFDKKKANIE